MKRDSKKISIAFVMVILFILIFLILSVPVFAEEKTGFIIENDKEDINSKNSIVQQAPMQKEIVENFQTSSDNQLPQKEIINNLDEELPGKNGVVGVTNIEVDKNVNSVQLTKEGFKTIIQSFSTEKSNVSKIKAETKEIMEIKNNTLYANNKEIKIMPNQAVKNAENRLEQVLEKNIVELVDNNNILTYEIQTEKKANLFGLISVKVPILISVDAQTGEINQIEKPWWDFLTISTEPKPEIISELETEIKNILIDFNIGACVNNNSKGNEQNDINAQLNGIVLTFQHNLKTYCNFAGLAEFEASVVGTTLKIKEKIPVGSSLAKCICTVPVSGIIQLTGNINIPKIDINLLNEVTGEEIFVGSTQISNTNSCGNEVCEFWENESNCPIDCKYIWENPDIGEQRETAIIVTMGPLNSIDGISDPALLVEKTNEAFADLNEFVKTNSYNKTWISERTLGPFDIGTGVCEINGYGEMLDELVRRATAAAGNNILPNSKIIVFHPFCEDVIMSFSWRNIWSFEPGIFRHEFGHSMKTGHLGARKCFDENGNRVFLSDNCENFITYFDSYDAMTSVYRASGNNFYGGFSSINKGAFGWLDENNFVVTNSGLYTITPLEYDNIGIKAIKVPLPKMKYQLYIELRDQNKVVVHVEDGGFIPYLIIPEDDKSYLELGKEYSIKEAGISLKVTEIKNNDYAKVLITSTTNSTQCNDGIDNDSYVDWLYDATDFSCSRNGVYDSNVLSEFAPVPSCWDGYDNDYDGFTDFTDSDCVSVNDDTELKR